MFILQVPTTMPPGGPTTNVGDPGGVDDLIGEVNRTTVPPGSRPTTTTREPSPRDVIDTVNTGGPTTSGGGPQGGDNFSSQAAGDSTRRFLTTASDGYWTYRTVSYLGSTNPARTILPGISRPPVAPPAAIPVTTPLPPGAPIPPVATRAAGSSGSWLLRTNFARHMPRAAGFLSKGGGFLRGAGGLAGRALPYAGGVLAALDVTLDWVNYGNMDSGGDLVARALSEAQAQGVTLSATQIASARALADKDLSRPENITALRQHLESCGLNGSDADTLAQAGRQQQEAKSSACTGAIINTTCTAAGAIIGGIIGSIIPGAGTILGACIGAAIGNLVGGVVNMFRSGGLLSGIGGFFRGFFGGRR